MSEGSNRLAVLAAGIRSAHEGVRAAEKTRAHHAIEAGHALLEAKGLLKHGQWLPWLKENCALPERTAQLYMKLAELGVPAEIVAVIGMEAAARATDAVITITTPNYDPFAHCDEEARRQWLLFGLFIGDTQGAHVEWLLNKQFGTPDAWLGEEGARFRRQCGLRHPKPESMARWTVFQQKHQDTSRAEIEDEHDRRQKRTA